MFSQTVLIDAATRFDDCSSDIARWRCGNELVCALGSDWLTAGTATRSVQSAQAIRTSTPDALMRDYIAAEIYLEDPWLAHCATSTAISTCDVRQIEDGVDNLPQRQANLFADHGIHRAMLIPCYGGPRPGGMVLYARDGEVARWMDTPEGNAVVRMTVALIAAYYRPEDDSTGDDQCYRLHRKLTAREREALEWLSKGLQSEAIAERMRISTVMVAKHLAHARRKLGARTREQALAIAIRDSLVAI